LPYGVCGVGLIFWQVGWPAGSPPPRPGPTAEAGGHAPSLAVLALGLAAAVGVRASLEGGSNPRNPTPPERVGGGVQPSSKIGMDFPHSLETFPSTSMIGRKGCPPTQLAQAAASLFTGDWTPQGVRKTGPGRGRPPCRPPPDPLGVAPRPRRRRHRHRSVGWCWGGGSIYLRTPKKPQKQRGGGDVSLNSPPSDEGSQGIGTEGRRLPFDRSWRYLFALFGVRQW